MGWEGWFYVFGTLFFASWLVLAIVLIVAALMIMKNLNKIQIAIQQAMEENPSLVKTLPMMLVASLEARDMYKRIRGR